MFTVTDEMKGPGLVFLMLKKCLGDDFDAKANCSQIAFTKDYKVTASNCRCRFRFTVRSECRVRRAQ